MAARKTRWKKGRGKLGFLDPLLGTWKATADSPMGPIECTRSLAKALNAAYVQLDAVWKFGRGAYLETAFIGVCRDGTVGFWSFTSDGKHSEGRLADVSDVHPEAIGFEAEMPAGVARMIYWPDEKDGFHWAVESKQKRGWKRFTEHHFKAR